MRTVGIIGGLGPETAAQFYLEVLSGCQQKEKTARPAVVMASVPLPFAIEEDFIMKNEGAERYVPFLTAEAQRLEKAGADFIVMPCNSLHVFLEDIRKSIHVPVLSIIEETVAFLKENGFKKVGIVSTLATVKSGLYETAFQNNGIAYERPNDVQQEQLGQFILNLVMSKKGSEDREGLIKIINDFSAKKVDCVMLACTDLQLLAPEHPTLKIFDTMKIFADATVREILK